MRVVGPLYGRQSKNGYDMKPGMSLSVARLPSLLHALALRPEADGLGPDAMCRSSRYR